MFADERSPAHGAGRIDRHPSFAESTGRLDSITFDTRTVDAIEGEPLIVALLAAGVRVLRTMPRTGEARGGYCLVGRCADCLVMVDGSPNVRACVEKVRAGMIVETQHGLGARPELAQ